MKYEVISELKKSIRSGWGMKLMALVGAALAWLIIVNVDDPIDSAVFRGIPVTVTNAEIVTNQGKNYQILDDTQTVSVVVNAKRSVLSHIKSDDIVATADMRELEIETLVPIKVSVSGHEGNDVSAEATPHNLQVRIEAQTKNTFPLTVSMNGTQRDGYVLGTATTTPASVTIRGSESLIASISKAAARIDVSGLAADADIEGELILYDVNENVIDQTQLTNNLGDSKIMVHVQVLSTKMVPLEFRYSGTPAEGYVYSGISSEPTEVQVSGTAEQLRTLDELVIPANEINIEDASERVETVVDISPYLPEGVELVDDTASNVIVSVGIEEAGTRTIEFPVEGIGVNNLRDDLRVSYESGADLQLQFRGSQEALEMLDIRNAVTIDLKGSTTEGTYEVPVVVEVPGTIELVSEPKVKVKLTEKEAEE